MASNHHEDKGLCVDICCEINPIYRDYTVTEGNQKVLYVHITEAIYGMLVSAMLFYHKLTKALLWNSFELNPYHLCVANRKVNGEQLTISWHVDDLKSSHIDPKVNDEFCNGLKTCSGNSEKSR